MANKEHLEILKKEVEVWNKWREENPEVIPDLSLTDLRGANLVGADLHRADLNGADLSGAFLGRADLSGANLTGVDLRWASLWEADLSWAVLRAATFTPEGKPIGLGSFRGLASCEGLETVRFSEPDFLANYLTRVFEYAHEPDIRDAREWPDFIEQYIKYIKVLRQLYTDKEPPEQLIKMVGVITDELIRYLKRHPEAMYQIRPRQFEEHIAEILASFGWQVQLTPPVKDGGYDIYAVSKDIKGDVETSWIIECKKNSPERKVGVDVVRALYGVKGQLQAVNALLATTSYFTEGAKELKASRYDIELKDYEGILEWINEYRPNPNGKLYIKDNKLIVPGDD
jgi:HJR/Mrr/RecB family endonuclease